MARLSVCLLLMALLSPHLPARDRDGAAPASPAVIGDIRRLDTGRLDLPLENNGDQGNDGRTWYPSGQTTLSLLFSSGPCISGYHDGEIRTAWMASTSRIMEMQPGVAGGNPDAPEFRFYEVRSTDGFGSTAYNEWADAVAQGAAFQDLDGDGLYDPNTDRPDILGDHTLWCAYNDLTDSLSRSRLDANPLAIEIHQTAWSEPALPEVAFLRYRIINRSVRNYTDVLVSQFSDPDIGSIVGYQDDLIGSDPGQQLAFSYNDGPDNDYGNDPPAIGFKLLQGPIVSAPGDTAYRFGGPFFGTDILPGFVNREIHSVTFYIGSDPVVGDPNTAQQARWYQEGGVDMAGIPINPADWGTGGFDNPDSQFFFNGDPVTGSGWLDDTPADKRLLITSGPFDMAPGDTQDVIIAVVTGRGSDALDSVTRMRQAARDAETYIGFSLSGLGEPGNRGAREPGTFVLKQNYPNPFNPSTRIAFAVDRAERVTLTVYDIRGRRVATLLDGPMAAGRHRVTWNGRDAAGRPVAGGVYVYRLTAGTEMRTRKMVLLK